MSVALEQLHRQRPELLAVSPIVGLSTDDEPTVDADGGELEVGATWLHEDTGVLHYYTGVTGRLWRPVDLMQFRGLELSLLFEIRDLLKGDEE